MRRIGATDVLAAATLIIVAWLVSSFAPAPVRTASAEVVAAEQKEAAYVGNINTKKFHRTTCRYAKCTNCRAKFATRDEALAAGFDPCGICEP